MTDRHRSITMAATVAGITVSIQGPASEPEAAARALTDVLAVMVDSEDVIRLSDAVHAAHRTLDPAKRELRDMLRSPPIPRETNPIRSFGMAVEEGPDVVTVGAPWRPSGEVENDLGPLAEGEGDPLATPWRQAADAAPEEA